MNFKKFINKKILANDLNQQMICSQILSTNLNYGINLKNNMILLKIRPKPKRNWKKYMKTLKNILVKTQMKNNKTLRSLWKTLKVKQSQKKS